SIPTTTTAIYTLSLHDALPICAGRPQLRHVLSSKTTPELCVTKDSSSSPFSRGLDSRHLLPRRPSPKRRTRSPAPSTSHSSATRSEEHTSELQSRGHLVCRLLL